MMKYPILISLIALTLPACVAPGSDAPAKNEPQWYVHCELLQGGPFQVCYGPGIKPGDTKAQFHDPSANTYLYYQVSVERIESPEISANLYLRTFPLTDVDPRFLTERAASVYTFDSASRTVYFSVGRGRSYFKLPAGT